MRPGAETALAAALGAVADAVAVADLAAAATTLDWLGLRRRSRRAAGRGRRGDPRRLASAARGRLWALDAVRAPARWVRRSPACSTASRWSTICAAASTWSSAHPDLRAVTADGDLLGAALGHRRPRRPAVAAGDPGRVRRRRGPAGRGHRSGRAARGRPWPARAPTPSAGARRRPGAGSAERLGRPDHRRRGAARPAGRGGPRRHRRGRAAGPAAADRRGLAQPAAGGTGRARGAAGRRRDPGRPDRRGLHPPGSLAEVTAQARQREMDARLALRTVEERARASAGTADNLRRAARAERETRARAEAARTRRAVAAAVADKVADRATAAAAGWPRPCRRRLRPATPLSPPAPPPSRPWPPRGSASPSCRAEWDRLTSEVHREEVLRAQQPSGSSSSSRAPPTSSPSPSTISSPSSARTR